MEENFSMEWNIVENFSSFSSSFFIARFSVRVAGAVAQE